MNTIVQQITGGNVVTVIEYMDMFIQNYSDSNVSTPSTGNITVEVFKKETNLTYTSKGTYLIEPGNNKAYGADQMGKTWDKIEITGGSGAVGYVEHTHQ